MRDARADRALPYENDRLQSPEMVGEGGMEDGPECLPRGLLTAFTILHAPTVPR